jgi:hypothetical protein
VITQPVVFAVKVIVVVPPLTPVNKPPASMVATAKLLLDHVPPPVVKLSNVIVEP